MSHKPLELNFNWEGAARVLKVLRECGPLKSKDIARELHRRGLMAPANAAAVNRHLREHLCGEVEQTADGRWQVAPAENSTG